eukprot:SAG31_NODE_2191_length_6228_cov_2.962806_5_plen_76_part_00
MQRFENKLAAEGVDLKAQCVFVEILVAVDEAGSEDDGWLAVQATLNGFNAYFDEAHRPAGVIYPVRSRSMSNVSR